MISTLKIQKLEEKFVSDAVGLQPLCFPPPFPEDLLWKEEHLRHHLKIFPEGQIIALLDNKVVASGTNLIISEKIWQAHGDFDATVGSFYLDNHDPSGTTLYGVDISVHPDYRGMGIGKKIYQFRFEQVKSLGLVRYGTSVRMPDYSKWAKSSNGTVQEYAKLVEAGELKDRTLTPMIKFGLKLEGIAEGHMDDPESGNAAAILGWYPM